MAANPSSVKLSFEEYLALEEKAFEKSEYRAGDMFAMAGGSADHARLDIRIGGILDRSLPHCAVYRSDLLVYVPQVNESMYPDASVICGTPSYYMGRKNVVLNPTLLVEVLSPGTREYDLSEKAGFYRTIPELQTILFLDSTQIWAQVQRRQGTDWLLTDYGADATLDLGLLPIAISDIYSGILNSQSS